MQKFKMFKFKYHVTWFDTLLAIEFIIACGTIAYVVGDMIAHAAPDMRGKITNSNGDIVWCTDNGRQWKPINNNCE